MERMRRFYFWGTCWLRAMGFRRPLKLVLCDRAPRKGPPSQLGAATRIVIPPFLQRGARGALLLAGRAAGSLSGQRGPPRALARRASRTHDAHAPPHAIQRPAAADGDQARTHRTMCHTWRRTRHHRGGPARAAPTRRGARVGSRGCRRERRHAPCGRGHALHTVCRTQRRRERLAGGPFRAPRRAEPRTKAGEGRPAPPHAHRAHRTRACAHPASKMQRMNFLHTFFFLFCAADAPTPASVAVCAAPEQGGALARGH